MPIDVTVELMVRAWIYSQTSTDGRGRVRPPASGPIAPGRIVLRRDRWARPLACRLVCCGSSRNAGIVAQSGLPLDQLSRRPTVGDGSAFFSGAQHGQRICHEGRRPSDAAVVALLRLPAATVAASTKPRRARKPLPAREGVSAGMGARPSACAGMARGVSGGKPGEGVGAAVPPAGLGSVRASIGRAMPRWRRRRPS